MVFGPQARDDDGEDRVWRSTMPSQDNKNNVERKRPNKKDCK